MKGTSITLGLTFFDSSHYATKCCNMPNLLDVPNERAGIIDA